MDIAQGGEKQVAVEVRNGQRAIGIDADKAGLAAAMRDIHLMSVVTLGVGGDEKGIGVFDQGAGWSIECAEGFPLAIGRRARIAVETNVAQLDIARAVAEALVHLHPDPLVD